MVQSHAHKRTPTFLETKWTTMIAGMFGNILEWYDFALYGFLAVIISEVFFAPGDPVSALLSTYGIFAVGFLARPVGAWLFGHIGDTFGRKPALLLSVLLMGIATTLLGLLPTYAIAGVWASILLVTLRLAQGLSVGGEFSTSVTYMVEHAPTHLRGLAGSLANVGSMAGMLLGIGAATLITTILSHEALVNWGWRIPFLFGGVLAIVAIALRTHLPSAMMHTEEERHSSDTPLREALATNRRELIQALSFSFGYAVLFYIVLVYLPTYANEFLHLPLDTALQINTLAIALTLVLIPIAGFLSDRFLRRKPLILISLITIVVVTIPLFTLLVIDGFLIFTLTQCILAALVAIPLGAAPALYVELFPRSDRLTAYSITFNVSLGIFGGTAPLIATWLVHATDNALMPAFYLVGTLLVSCISLLVMRDRSREPLR